MLKGSIETAKDFCDRLYIDINSCQYILNIALLISRMIIATYNCIIKNSFKYYTCQLNI